MQNYIEIQLVKLADGGRVLRLSQETSALSLEQRLNGQQPVVRQKIRLLRGGRTLWTPR